MARRYSPAGRFSQPDPYAGSYDFSDPQSLNRYAYVGNDPVNRKDPSGLIKSTNGCGSWALDVTGAWEWIPCSSNTVTVRDTGAPIFIPSMSFTSLVSSISMRGYLSGTRDHGADPGGGDPSSNGEPQNSVPCPSVPTHPANADIKANITEAKSHSAASVFNPAKLAVDAANARWFYNQVRNKGPWDYKQQGNQYQDFGNFNFGATGLATGLFNETVLLAEAGRAQVTAGTSKPGWGYPPTLRHPRGQPPYGDDPADQVQIKAGFAYYYAVKKGCK